MKNLSIKFVFALAVVLFLQSCTGQQSFSYFLDEEGKELHVKLNMPGQSMEQIIPLSKDQNLPFRLDKMSGVSLEEDYNGDGYLDLKILRDQSGSNFYDIWIYNSDQIIFEKNDVLSDIPDLAMDEGQLSHAGGQDFDYVKPIERVDPFAGGFEPIELIGYIQDSGLGSTPSLDYQMATYGFTYEEQPFSLVLPGYYNWYEASDGSIEKYFVTTDKDLGAYLGQCVSVSGEAAIDWAGVSYYAQSSILSLTDIEQIDFSNCAYDKVIPSTPPNTVNFVEMPFEQSGFIERTPWPGIEIGYEYTLVYEGGHHENPFYILPQSFEVRRQFEEVIASGGETRVYGVKQYGYAESMTIIVSLVEAVD